MSGTTPRPSRVLVTGGAGFVGSHLVDALLATGHDVAVLDDLSTGRAERLPAAAELIVGSVTDPEAVATAVRGAQVVHHLAAQIDVRHSVDDPAVDATTNVLGTVTVLEAARRAGVGRVLMASTGGALYGDADAVPTSELAPLRPLSPYAASKAAAEGYLELYRNLHGLSTMALRLANVYGPRQDGNAEAGVIARWCVAARDGGAVTVFGDGRQTRDFVYAGDVAEAFRLAGASDATGVCNIGTGSETSLLELIAALRLEPEFAPARAGEVRRSCLDPRRAEELLGWRARTSLSQGLEHTLGAVDVPEGDASH
jgi:UDP-glucose 4-epimerase